MNDGRSTGKVLLIGAGPGDPGLLTINAAKAIDAADVIVYDYLVNPEVLAHSRQGAELIYAGKRAGEHSVTQDEINKLLITRAQLGKLVARLKGGDPFVFGRGGEEAEALVEAGIDWEVIPGVSSGVASASYAGIPLTHRGYSSSVAFITGHSARDGKVAAVDWHVAAHSADTLVIFMCAGTIASIARELVESGRRPSTPVAIIRWGTYQHQEVHTGTLDDLIGNDDAGGLSVEPPVIAIVGEVVELSSKLNWFGANPVALSSQSPVGIVTPSDFETVSKGTVRFVQGESYVASCD